MIPILLHNTLSGKKEEFKPLVKGQLSMYQCGPTVYDSAHIGNLRTYVMNDLIRRVFEYNGYAVTQAMNITDVDDKTINRAIAEKTSLTELTRRYEALFLQDIGSLNILLPHRVLRATEHLSEMIEMISLLLEKGVAYPSSDGIYFSIGKSAGYGQLARLPAGSAIASAEEAGLRERIANDEYEKENPRDFALWKFSTSSSGVAAGEIGWDAPFGRGRPGWHIECSAMATRALGPSIDVHTGGADLIFPHHTNEIAQSEAATDTHPFVHYWIHGGFMNVNDAKMAKSKGNFLKLADLEADMISPLGFRYWLLTAHYRSQVNFSADAVKAAQSAFIRLVELFLGWSEDASADALGEVSSVYQKKFNSTINNDFDMPGAVALVWQLLKDKDVVEADKRATLLDFDRVFGLGLDELVGKIKSGSSMVGNSAVASEIPPEVTALAEAREEARLAKEWDKADALRQEIEARGYYVRDGKGGFVLEVI